MFLKLRRLGAVLVVLTAVASTVASPAQAAVTHDFEAESSPYILTGATPGKEAVFKFSSGAAVTCAANGLNGTVSSSPASSVTLQPTYGNCTLNELAATVDTPCNTLFTGETTAFEHGTVHIECANEASVRITVNGCTIEIGSQTPEQGTHYTNTGFGKTRDVDFKVTMTNTKYTKIGAACSLIAGLAGELSILGEYTVKAYADKGGAEGEQIGFWTKATVT
ncbi:MAG: hypothetical protein QOF06_2098 [Solirubrobacterales bacterium]|jgi:hypothetical protein|nr:hypothetical protein [Solirubrobacterales bacterium]